MTSRKAGDTDIAPFDEGPRASRVTYTEEPRRAEACAQLKAAIADGVSLPFTVRIREDMPRPDDIMYFSAGSPTCRSIRKRARSGGARDYGARRRRGD